MVVSTLPGTRITSYNVCYTKLCEHGETVFRQPQKFVDGARVAPAVMAQRADRAWVVERARAAGLTHVEMVGNYEFAVQGLRNNFV